MFETTVTLVGRLITPLQQYWFSDGTLKVSGRMACTERRYDRTAGEWTDGQTLYVSIVCKRGLADNAFISLRSGDPVVAHGRIYSREYEKDGKPQTITELEAWSVGPDLQWCTAVVTRKSRAASMAAASANSGAGDGVGAPAGAAGPDGQDGPPSGWPGPGLADHAGDGPPADDAWDAPGAGVHGDEAAVRA